MKKGLFILFSAFCWTTGSHAQSDKIVVTGSVQSDILIPQNDEAIGTEKTDDWALTNTYVDVRLSMENLEAGARFEYLKFPLPGFEKDIKGYGVPHFYVKGQNEHIDLTLGTFYEQFGSGFVLRTYEERSLGIDNALLGARVGIRPMKGVSLKTLSGFQRRYWSFNKNSLISGGDIELNLDRWIRALADGNTFVTLGASFVNKHEKASDDEIFATPTYQLNLPENVNAWDVRASVSHGDALNVVFEARTEPFVAGETLRQHVVPLASLDARNIVVFKPSASLHDGPHLRAGSDVSLCHPSRRRMGLSSRIGLYVQEKHGARR